MYVRDLGRDLGMTWVRRRAISLSPFPYLFLSLSSYLLLYNCKKWLWFLSLGLAFQSVIRECWL